MKLLFLDIDGVLNNHYSNPVTLCCGITDYCVDNLNDIIEETDCQIVLISAWRYMILAGAMTVSGFEYLLQTHGVNCHNRIIGYTNRDEAAPTRADLILNWLRDHNYERMPYAIVDDLDLGYTTKSLPFVETDGQMGLVHKDVNEIIKILNGGPSCSK